MSGFINRFRRRVVCWIPSAGAFILPQILATLGLLFTAAGVGSGISWLTQEYLAVDSRFIAVAVYTLGMALLTMVMGNAFAAFPIVTAGIGIPILVLQHGGNPAGNGGNWYVLWLLRDVNDADGGKL
ncbi:Protein of uncharacterised function (DUF979) [Citrobacter freundii]|nr:Protein of uncharacterised function (DUF979) [Citrobacter freundii]